MTGRSRPLCYRAASDADQPRAAPAPSTGARAAGRRDAADRPSVAILVAILVVLLLVDRPRRRAPGALVRRGRLQLLRAGLPDPQEPLDGPRVRPADDRLRPDRQGRARPARRRCEREVVTFDQIPGEMLDATTAIEDKDFWTNPGFDPVGIVSRRPRHPRRAGRAAPRRSPSSSSARACCRPRRSRARPTSARSARSSSRSA